MGWGGCFIALALRASACCGETDASFRMESEMRERDRGREKEREKEKETETEREREIMSRFELIPSLTRSLLYML